MFAGGWRDLNDDESDTFSLEDSDKNSEEDGYSEWMRQKWQTDPGP